jgi:hypothetical protein
MVIWCATMININMNAVFTTFPAILNQLNWAYDLKSDKRKRRESGVKAVKDTLYGFQITWNTYISPQSSVKDTNRILKNYANLFTQVAININLNEVFSCDERNEICKMLNDLSSSIAYIVDQPIFSGNREYDQLTKSLYADISNAYDDFCRKWD